MAVTKRYRIVGGKKKVFYQASIYLNGMLITNRNFATQTAAFVWHDEEKKKRCSGDSEQPAEDIFFADVVRLYVENALPYLRKSTQQAIGTRIRYLTESPVAKVYIKDFSVKDLDRWFAWLHKHHAKTNPHRRSFKHEFKLMSIVLNWYRNEINHRFVSPMVKRHSKKCEIPGMAKERLDRYLKKEEVAIWLHQLAQHPNPIYYDLAKFMVLTGVRLGEACGLFWDAVDLNGRCISILRTVNWDLNSKSPSLLEVAKNEESIRVVGLSMELVEMLQKKQKASNPKSPVFCNRDGGLQRQTKIYDIFTKAFKDTGLEWSGTRITRHTWATLSLVANGGNITAIQANLGHRNRKTTERYAKPISYLFGSVVDKTAEYLQLPQENHVTNHVTKKKVG
jgi:integrase